MIPIRFTPQEGAFVPARANDAALYDLYSTQTSTIRPGGVQLVSTKLVVEVPSGYVLLILARSGLATHGVFPVNAPGVIDEDYRGELKVILGNMSNEPYVVERGDRIAQCLLVPKIEISWKLVGELNPSHTGRGAGGFGHTGR